MGTILLVLIVIAWLAMGIKVGNYIHKQATKEVNQDDLIKIAYQDGYGDGYNDGRKSK